jgi:hypothetical protein
MTAGWGEPGDGEGGEVTIPGSIDLGNGHRMTLNVAEFRRLLHRRDVVAAITERANAIADAANGMIGLDPDTVARVGATQDGPAYVVQIQDESETTRARARVTTNGELGKLDQQTHLTLMKAMDEHPSDRKPEL